jgi:hypothetical protein
MVAGTGREYPAIKEMKPLSAKTKSGASRFSTSLIIGLLLVPLSAVAAVALVTPDAPAETETVAVAETTLPESTTTSADAVEPTVAPEIASAEDLVAACGDQGMSLVAKEADASISPLEQAALDSLRAICETEGMALPGKPAPEAIVQTMTVAAPATGGSNSTASSPAETTTTTTTTVVDPLAAQFEAYYAETVAYINGAINNGASGNMIDLATRLVGEAADLADSGNYAAGMAKLDEARNAADQAGQSSSSDDDDDHEHEDDHDDDHDGGEHGDD